MKSLFIVIYYTIKQTLKKKSFWVTNIIMGAIIFIAFAFVSRLNFSQLDFSSSSNDKGILESTLSFNRPKEALPRVLVIDKSGLLGDYINLLYDTEYNFVIDNSINQETFTQEINDEKTYATIILKEFNGSLSFDYMVLEDSKYNTADAKLISGLLKEIQITKVLDKTNLPKESIETINTVIDYNINIVKDMTPIDNATIISIALAFILFFAIYFYSYTISSSVSSEKTSRVIETLIASTSPNYIIIGKTIGMGVLRIATIIVFVHC